MLQTLLSILVLSNFGCNTNDENKIDNTDQTSTEEAILYDGDAIADAGGDKLEDEDTLTDVDGIAQEGGDGADAPATEEEKAAEEAAKLKAEAEELAAKAKEEEVRQ